MAIIKIKIEVNDNNANISLEHVRVWVNDSNIEFRTLNLGIIFVLMITKMIIFTNQ